MLGPVRPVGPVRADCGQELLGDGAGGAPRTWRPRRPPMAPWVGLGVGCAGAVGWAGGAEGGGACEVPPEDPEDEPPEDDDEGLVAPLPVDEPECVDDVVGALRCCRSGAFLWSFFALADAEADGFGEAPCEPSPPETSGSGEPGRLLVGTTAGRSGLSS